MKRIKDHPLTSVHNPSFDHGTAVNRKMGKHVNKTRWIPPHNTQNASRKPSSVLWEKAKKQKPQFIDDNP